MTETDQEARDLARAAMSEIRQHAAVCLEAEKRRTQFENDMRQWMKQIQDAYQTGMENVAIRKDTDQKAAELKEEIADLYSRFWALSLAYGSTVTVLVAWMFAKLMKWL